MSALMIDKQATWDGAAGLTLRTLLFATDFSSACDNAWPYAVALAGKFQSKLLLAHVIAPSIYAAVPAQLLSAARQQARLEAESRMAYLQQLQGGRSHLSREVLLREGEVTETLMSLIMEHQVDLLVTATRGHRHLKRLLLGSTAEKLFRQAPCPVLVVPERARMVSNGTEWIRRMVCPVDFSPGSSAAVAYAASLARTHGAQLIVTHVLRGAARLGEDRAQDTRSVEDRLQQLLPADLALSFTPRFEVAFGAPARSISRVAAESQADLVVMAVHPASEIAAHQAERTAYRVIRWSHCPVLTIPQSRPVPARN